MKKTNKKTKRLAKTEELVDVVHALRKKCPWDKKQTHQSLTPYLIEEAYEAIDAIQAKDKESMKEELGDVLLQVVLHAEIASEKGHFDFEAIAESIAEKMIRRHPHVFTNPGKYNVKEHLKNWTRLKEEEKKKKNKKTSILDGLPRSMPALQLSQRYGETAAGVGFDWSNAKEVFEKVREEINELEAELENGSKKNLELELGDVLHTLSHLARHLGLSSETALKKSLEKFYFRFTKMEKLVAKQGKTLRDYNFDDLNDLWDKVKR